jgi:hypothetical protein
LDSFGADLNVFINDIKEEIKNIEGYKGIN